MQQEREALGVVIVKVRDFREWRKVFDEHAPARAEAGVVGAEVFQAPDDPNGVVVVTRFRSIAALRAFAEAPQTLESMARAGVISPPSFVVGFAI
jgi:quinol monooxygenase YgiN